MMIPGGPATGPVSRADPSIRRTLPNPAARRTAEEGDEGCLGTMSAPSLAC